MDEPVYVLRDSRTNVGANAMFWMEGGSYTSNLNKAERFTRSAAMRQQRSRDTDQALPLNMLLGMAHITVDCQHLPDPANYNSQHHSQYVVQVCRKWDGNDIYFLGAGDKHTTSLNKATIYSRTEALKASACLSEAQLWPIDVLRTIGRPVVQAKDIKRALKQAEAKALELLETQIA